MILRLTHSPLVAGLLALAMTNCGGAPTSSHLQGHFENLSSDEDFLGWNKQQKILPETPGTKVDAVMVSINLLAAYDSNTDLVNVILESGIKTLVVVLPKGGRATLDNQTITYRAPNKTEDETFTINIGKEQRIKFITNTQDQAKAGGSSVWVRDYGPLAAAASSGEIRLMDFNYYGDKPADDKLPREIEIQLDKSPVRIPMPLYFEGGNFMVDDNGYCVMSDEIVADNKKGRIKEDLDLNKSDIEGYFESHGGCTKVSIRPSMPYEGTHHIDLWAKFVGKNTVLVGELDAELRKLPMYQTRYEFYKKFDEVKKFLDDEAANFANDGINVVRVPMPAPAFRYVKNGTKSELNTMFRSYLNSLIVNDKVIVPEYVSPGDVLGIFGNNSGKITYPDQEFLLGWEDAVREAYEQAGLEVFFVQSDDLIENGGAVHCVTMQVPTGIF